MSDPPSLAFGQRPKWARQVARRRAAIFSVLLPENPLDLALPCAT
jgi:hypothetical protein